MAAKLKKFVTINAFTSKTNVGVGFNVLRKAINRTGTTLDGVNASVKTQAVLQKFQADYLADNYVKQITIVRKGTKQKNTFFTNFNKRIKRMFAVKKRQKAEDAGEDGIKEGRSQTEKLIQKIGKPIENFMGFFGKTIGNVIKYFVIFGALNWITKNPEKVAKLGRLIFAIGKFGFTLTKLGVGAMLTGLTNLVGDYSDKNAVEQGLRKFLGVFQLLGGIAALKTVQYLVMPWKLISDVQGINSIFAKSVETSEEIKASSKARLKGYKDAKTGVIYTEKEYKAMKKSAQRADAKRGARAGKGMKSDLYGKEFDKRFQGVYGNKRKTRLDRLQQRGRILRGKGMKGISKFAKANPAKVTGALSVLGGGLRIASGLASGEEAGQAIGAGVGQAAGGIAGAAALTAVAPFLGPLAPMIGSAVGGFLGEWVGKTFGKIVQPIFDPIGRAFKMYFKLAMDITKPFRDNLGPLLGAVFQVIGGIGEMIFKSLKPLLDFTGFVLKLAGGVLAETVSFVINNAKRLMDPKSMAAGFFDAITFNAFDLDGMQREEGKKAWWDPAGVFTGEDGGSSNKKNKAWWDPAGVFAADGGAITDNMRQALQTAKFAEGGFYKAVTTLPLLKEMSEGGKTDKKYTMGYRMGQIIPDQFVYSYKKFVQKTVVKNDKLVEDSTEFTDLGGSIEVNDLYAHKEQLLNHPLLKSFKIADIINGTTGLEPEVLYPILMGSDAQKATDEKIMNAIRLDMKKMEKKFGKGNGWSWYNEDFSEGGEVGKVGKWVMDAPPVKALESLTKFIIPQEDRRQRFMESLTQVKDNVFEFVKDGIDTIRGIEPTEGTQAKIVESESEMQAKAQRDADDEIQNEVIVLKQNVTQPVINNVVSGQPKFVYVNSKSPMLTEFV